VKTESNKMIKDIQRRKRWKFIVINSVAVIGAVAIFTLLGFVGKKQHDSICWKLDVQIEEVGDKKYIDEKLVTSMANAATDQIVGKPVNEIDITAIHKKLTENSSIREAHVFTTVDGRCVVRIKQRTPIARIFTSEGKSFYLDKDGFTMALSDYYTAKVPVFTGAIYETMKPSSILDRNEDAAFLESTLLDEIYTFTKYIEGNEFWKAQVEHVHITEDKEFEIIPRVGNHRIRMGKVENLEEKFKKLMTFYANTIHSRDLNLYSSINVKYDGQVVCVKR
jgi:cell division protein FtsQ